MKKIIKYEPINERYFDEAVDLVLNAYCKEKTSIPFLPLQHEIESYLKQSIRKLFIRGNGIVATRDDQLIGFLAGVEVDELFGKCKGIYVPLYGHGVIKENSKEIYQKLYEHASDLWVKESFMTHAITLFANNKEAINTWFWLGFGMRCVDGIREAAPTDSSSPSITIKKAELSDVPDIADIHNEHIRYYRKPPIFMPKQDEDPIKDLTEWLENPNHHLWTAYNQGQPLGYMRIEPNGETFISEHPDIMNITGAYVRSNERQSGIGAMLLDEILKWLVQNDYPLCGVDFEAINTIGSCFWTKHFTPYTYSLVRRIDERILNIGR